VTSPKIAELPFIERPLRALLDLEIDRDQPNRAYAGFGWAHADEVWLEVRDATAHRVDDALVIALHTADDAQAVAGDLELELDLPDRPVTVLASAFLDRWLPRLPQHAAIVLAVCNPHRAVLRRPAAATVPVHLALGNVAAWSWYDPARGVPAPGERGDRILLTADDWCTL
jgi:hypothetical protein